MANETEEALKRTDFIIKLAESQNLGDKEASQAILAQLRQLEGNTYFPYLYKKLVPANYDSTTKLASPRARQRLTEATRLYSEAKRAEAK